MELLPLIADIMRQFDLKWRLAKLMYPYQNAGSE